MGRINRYAGVAQSVVQRICNAKVGGSIPLSGTVCCGKTNAKGESVCKPGSVADDHSSGICVSANLKQSTRRHNTDHVCV